jgi:hypothetical protein
VKVSNIGDTPNKRTLAVVLNQAAFGEARNTGALAGVDDVRLADFIGVTPNTLSRAQDGDPVSAWLIAKVVLAFDVPIARLFKIVDLAKIDEAA